MLRLLLALLPVLLLCGWLSSCCNCWPDPELSWMTASGNACCWSRNALQHLLLLLLLLHFCTDPGCWGLAATCWHGGRLQVSCCAFEAYILSQRAIAMCGCTLDAERHSSLAKLLTGKGAALLRLCCEDQQLLQSSNGYFSLQLCIMNL
jgi:hypothetical protein